MFSLVILTEGGENIGYGHLTRCMALAKYGIEKGYNVKILLQWYGPVANPTLYPSVDWLNKETLEEVKESYDFAMVDSYKAPPEFFSWLKHQFKKVFVIDDYGRLLNFGADLIVNPNIYAESMPYNAKFIGGKDYIILREAFRLSAEKLIVRNKVKNVIVTLGGSDFRKLLISFAEVFQKMSCHFDFVCGNRSYAEELENKFIGHSNYTFHGFLSDCEMKSLMVKSDIAVSACGQTLHELAFLGIPTIGICIDFDQEMNSRSYFQAGFLADPIVWMNGDISAIVLKQFIELLPFDRRSSRSAIGKKLIDGKGVQKIFATLEN